ncbi:bifunctional Helicase superfamily 1-2 [Babesia duncani]|uniref:Bifunctional Helicase superfamily 1-2 n=1 Tax=Babesia duncani TaxID=323732 RepID=A0AAD9UP09_9APIC|nr:bifunctional Helicase superfamily 1-2 [Babesia duncani]
MINNSLAAFTSSYGNVIYTNCLLDVNSKCWLSESDLKYYKKTNKKNLLKYKCFVTKSKKDQHSTCSGCRNVFLPNRTKYGFPWKSVKGKFGFVNKWYHPECSSFIFCALLQLVDYSDDEEEINKTKSKNDEAFFPFVKYPNDENDVLSFNVPEDKPKGWVKFNKPSASTVEEWLSDIEDKVNQMCFGIPKKGRNKDEVVNIVRNIVGNYDKIPRAVIIDASRVFNQSTIEYSIPQISNLIIPLLPFQKDGFEWMYKQELGPIGGGILADEMGMGKTIQTIALLVAKKNEEIKEKCHEDMPPKPIYKPEMPMKKRKIKNGKDKSLMNVQGGTLIICPPVALLQWYNELQNKVTDDFFTIAIYHGQYRNNLANVLHNYDIVLTTYSIVEYEYRKIMNRKKVPCEHCGRMYLPKALMIHNKYFCGPDAKRTVKQMLTERKTDQKILAAFAQRTGIAALSTIINGRMKTEVEGDANSDTEEVLDAEKLINIIKTEPESEIRENDNYEEIVNGLCNLGFERTDVDNIVQEHKGDLLNSMYKLKELAESSNVDSELLAILESFTRMDVSDSDIKSYTLVKYRELLNKLGIASFGNKVEVMNRIIIFIKKWSSLSPGSAATLDKIVKNEPLDSSHKDSVEKASIKREAGAIAMDNADDEFIDSNLHSIIWKRIVIDEAHRIKTKSSSTAQGIFALKSCFSRWCLTGTPLQNRVGDVFSLVRFLQMYPYAYILCNREDCTCACTDLKTRDFGKCDVCGHGRAHHYSYFNRHILNPIVYSGYANDGKRAMDLLHNDVFKRILLRRTKLEKADDVRLPPLNVKIRRDQLTEQERDFYTAIENNSLVKFDTFVQEGTLLHNYAHIFDLLTRLRQAVDHPYLIIYGPSSIASKAHDAKAFGQNTLEQEAIKKSLPALGGTQVSCSLCFQMLGKDEEYSTAKCTHAFHDVCLADYQNSRPDELQEQAVNCPMCFVPLVIKSKNVPTFDDVQGNFVKVNNIAEALDDNGVSFRGKMGILKYIDPSKFKSSTKIEALMQEVTKVLCESSDKCIIFSQYCAMLELVALRFKTANIKCAVLAGCTSFTARKNILVEFNHSDLRVLLISLKAGGEGLNLQVANHIFIMDPWWNPASELQAIQRAHRIGQTKPVYATRFIMSDTIETKILELQEKKMIVFDAVGFYNNQHSRRWLHVPIQWHD